jgi:hypothetical protein
LVAQTSVGGAVHFDLLYRKGGVDTPVASGDGAVAAMPSQFVPDYVTTFNAAIDLDLAGAAVPAACGDQLVVKLAVTQAASDLFDALWLDVP